MKLNSPGSSHRAAPRLHVHRIGVGTRGPGGKALAIPHTKNGEPITLPLNPDALRPLANFRFRGNGCGHVVRKAAGETLLVNAHWFPDAVRAAWIAPFRWHDSRHTFASRLRQNGVPLETIAEPLGHSPKRWICDHKTLRPSVDFQPARCCFPEIA